MECRGYEIRDQEGEKVGKVDEVFVDENDRPEYLGVKTGLLGGKLVLIPADLARTDDERRLVEVSDSKSRVKDAPSVGADEEITAKLEDRIRDYFRLDSGSAAGTREMPPLDRDAEPREPGSRSEQDGTADEGREPPSDPDAAGADAPREDHPGTAGPAPGNPVSGREDKETGEPGQSGRPADGHGGRETVRVSVWRERARAEKVLGDDGNEEVRIRKEWTEEEEMVEVEDERPE